MRHPRPKAKKLLTLANEIADYRYDALLDLLRFLAERVASDANDDGARGRPELAFRLKQLSGSIEIAASDADEVWRICEKHMEVEDA